MKRKAAKAAKAAKSLLDEYAIDPRFKRIFCREKKKLDKSEDRLKAKAKRLSRKPVYVWLARGSGDFSDYLTMFNRKPSWERFAKGCWGRSGDNYQTTKHGYSNVDGMSEKLPPVLPGQCVKLEVRRVK